ncbi:MAG TPA: VIT family protein [Caulobacteraceae bacterium]|jgi:VIT1/CCC1 family predicted Fe2+/Mn2+ transporter
MVRRWHRHRETHFVDRVGWLRAAVLGANDGILSVASLITGVASAQGGREAVLVAGVAGWLAGAMSMAAGEYVSVSSQADSEKADLAREREELKDMPEAELEELTHIYVKRGLEPALARQVAVELTHKDALEAHARDELGISEATQARPIQAAIASAASFSLGSAMPLLVVLLAPTVWLVPAVIAASLLLLGVLGAVGARTGGADAFRATLRVLLWGAAAMLATAAVGRLFGVGAS